MPIQIVKLPQMRKRGQEDQNKRLFKARMESGQRWIQHLPGAFHADLISTMFLDVDKVEATKAIKQSQKMCLRLGPHDSASLKSYGGLNNKQYVRLNRMLFYLSGLWLLAPIKSVRRLKDTQIKGNYKTLTRRVVDMTRVTKKGGTTIERKIHVGVVTVHPYEIMTNVLASLLEKGKLLPSSKRFKLPCNIPANTEDVVLWKIAADKGGGSFKLLINAINVECPQSLKHVRPLCEFRANDSRENMTAAVFYNGSPCRAAMEDVLHRRTRMLHVKIADSSGVGLVVNTSTRHHYHKPMALTDVYRVARYSPKDRERRPAHTDFANQIARVDFGIVKAILFMYNTEDNTIDEMNFVDEDNVSLDKLTLNVPIPCQYEEAAQHQVAQYLMAGVLTGDLDFLSNFLGHQGASSKWLCFYCLASHDRLKETFELKGEAPRFPKRKGVNSLRECYKRYKREYMNLEPRHKTKARRTQVTQEISFSIVGAPLADVPLDLIAPATMHVILGLTKNIYKWLLKMFSTLE